MDPVKWSVAVKVKGCELGGMKVAKKVSHIVVALEIFYFCFCFCYIFCSLFIVAYVDRVWYSTWDLSLGGEERGAMSTLSLSLSPTLHSGATQPLYRMAKIFLTTGGMEENTFSKGICSCHCFIIIIIIIINFFWGARGRAVVEALCYKPEGRRIASR
jgi:hypothetical protein